MTENSNPRIERACEARMWYSNKLTAMMLFVLNMYFISPIVYMLTNGLTLSSPGKPFPYQMRYPYDAQPPWPYIFTYISAIQTGASVVFQWFAQDALFGLFVSYTCGQFELLHEDISHIIPDCYETCLDEFGQPENIPEWRLRQESLKRLHDLSKRHNRIIEFCQLLEKVNGFPLLFNFISSTFLICAIGFQFLTANFEFIGDYAKFLVFLLSILAQLYVICLNGNEIIEHSTATAWHLYACNWEGGRLSEHSPIQSGLPQLLARSVNYHTTDREFQMHMKFMIMRSQRPVQLTALQFSVLSLQTFTKLLSSSMSYFTMLRQFLDK